MKKDSPTPEFDMASSWQCAMECGHSKTHGKLIESMVSDTDERNKLFDGLNQYNTIGAKRDWYLQNSKPDLRLARRLITQLCVEGIHFLTQLCSEGIHFLTQLCSEGIHFSSSFALIAWLRKRLPGRNFLATCTLNDLIMRDEALHAKILLRCLNGY